MDVFNVFAEQDWDSEKDREGYQAMLRTEPKLDYWEGES